MKKLIIALILCAFLVSVFSGCLVITVNETSNTESKPTEVKEASVDTPKAEYKIGDVVDVDDISVCVKSVKNAKQVGDEYLGSSTENNFVLVEVALTNNASKEASVLSGDVKYFQDGSEYQTSSAALYVDKGFTIIETIGSKLTNTVIFVFEVPSEYTDADYLYINFNMFKDEARIYMK